MIYDYVIVGSGLGGGILSQFISAGRTIALIEAGVDKGNSENIGSENIGLEFKWPVTRSIEVGGTSNLWHGVLAPLDEIDFEKRDWIPNSGWPISYDDLHEYYNKAADFLKVKEFEYYQKENGEKHFNDELKKISISQNFDVKFFQQPVPPLRIKGLLANKSSNLIIFKNTIALELISDDGINTTSIKCFSKITNEFIEIKGNKFIVCAGSLETPRLLKNSTTLKSVSNANIGCYLMDHPMGNILQIKFKNPVKAAIYSDKLYAEKNKIKAGIVLSRKSQQKLQLPNNNFYIRPSFRKGINNETEKVKLSLLAVRNNKVSFHHILQILKNINLVKQIITYKLSLDVTYSYADLFLMTEQIPYKESAVTLSEKKDAFGYKLARINWQLSSYDLDAAEKYVQLIHDNCFSREEVDFTFSPHETDWKNVFTSAAHHVGTARMATSENYGVVDKNLKIFNSQNVYVCDGSVFSTSGNVNSGFTIIALAIRLAEHLNSIND